MYGYVYGGDKIKKYKITFRILVLTLFLGITIYISITNHISKEKLSKVNIGDSLETKTYEESPKENELRLNKKMGKRPDYSTVCNASEIMDKNIEYILSVDLEAEFQKPSFKSEFVEVLSYLSTEDNSVLYGQNGCYVSTYSVCMYNIHDNKLSNVLRSYIFTDNKEEVGEIFFDIVNGKLSYSIISNDLRLNTKSDILELLEEDRKKTYIILTNGNHHMFLDEDNNITNGWATLDDFEIIGDCYNALNSDVLGVSYNDIIEDNNLVWIEFD